MKDIYKTVWEVKMKSVIDLAADRGAFVDQSQVCESKQSVFKGAKVRTRVRRFCTARYLYNRGEGAEMGSARYFQ